MKDQLPGLDGDPSLPNDKLDGGLDLGFSLLVVCSGKKNVIFGICIHEGQLVLTCDARKSIS